MSVLECDRRGCENIMCDWFSYQYGYLCDECRGELLSVAKVVPIHVFMDSAKPSYDVSAGSAERELIEQEFQPR